MISNSSIIPPNRVKQKLQQGNSVFGTFVVEFRQASVMQLLADAGFDFATIDNEHGAFSLETIADLSRAAVLLGITPIVRIPDISYPYIAQTLDIGAQGLMVPRITNADQVKNIVRWLQYPPHGERGNAMERGLSQFRSGSVSLAIEEIPKQILLIIQIETQQAIEAIEEILSVPGVDAALIGPNDLSIAMGLPGQQDHPVVQSAIRNTIMACEQHGVVPGIHMGNLDLALYWSKQGMRLVSTGSEVAFLSRAAQASVQKLRG
jgi:2-keto-3-deoxy-L-rhamnonate aldolase RhmA